VSGPFQQLECESLMPGISAYFNTLTKMCSSPLPWSRCQSERDSQQGVHMADTSYAHGRRVPIIGFTATFKRDDQLALSAAYEKIVFHRETRTMLSEGW